MSKKLLTILLFLTIITSSSFAFASDGILTSQENLNEYGLCIEAVNFLEKHGVNQSIFKDATITDIPQLKVKANSDPGNNNKAILSLMRQAEANNFTDEQIQAYVRGLIETPTIAVELGSEITTSADNRPNDSGIGYEVKSNNGYYQTTGFAKIPSVYRASTNDTSAYMFYTLSDMIDIGIWYSNGAAGEGWRYFWLYGGQSLQTSYDTISGLYSGKDVYFNAEVIDNNWARLRVLDGTNFNTVYVDFSIYIGGYGITKTNANWNRQITLCTDGSMSNGSYMTNAEFSQAYIYKTNGTYSKTVSSNTVSNRRGAFGINNTTLRKVTVNDYTPWYMENIGIRFD